MSEKIQNGQDYARRGDPLTLLHAKHSADDMAQTPRLLPSPTPSPESTQPSEWDRLVGANADPAAPKTRRARQARHANRETLSEATVRRARSVADWMINKAVAVQLDLAERRTNPQTFVDAMNPYDTRTYDPRTDAETDDPNVLTHKGAMLEYLPEPIAAKKTATVEAVPPVSGAPAANTQARESDYNPDTVPPKAFPELAGHGLNDVSAISLELTQEDAVTSGAGAVPSPRLSPEQATATPPAGNKL